MNILSIFKRNKEESENIGGMQDYMSLIRVYLQAAVASQIGINNISLLPDLRLFKTTFKIHTEHNKLGPAEKNASKKMLKNMYGHDDSFFKEIDKSISKNCRKIQDVQTYMYQFQGFTQDLMMLTGNLMKFKLRLPSFFKKAIYAMTEKTINDIFSKNNFNDAATVKAVYSVRKYNQKLSFSQDWITNFVYQVVMLAKKEKMPKENKQ